MIHVDGYNFYIDFSFTMPLGLAESDVYSTELSGTIWTEDDQGENREKAGTVKVYLVDLDKMLNENRSLIDAFDECGHEIMNFYAPLFDDTYDEEVERNRPQPTPEEILAQFKEISDRSNTRSSIYDEPEEEDEEITNNITNSEEEDEFDGEEEFEEVNDEFSELFSKYVLEIAGQSENYNILIIDEIAIKPKFRKHELGLNALSYIIYKFQMNCAVVAMQPIPMQHYNNLEDKTKQEYDLASFEANQDKATQKLRKYWNLLGFKKLPNCSVMVLDFSEFKVLRKHLWDDMPVF